MNCVFTCTELTFRQKARNSQKSGPHYIIKSPTYRGYFQCDHILSLKKDMADSSSQSGITYKCVLYGTTLGNHTLLNTLYCIF